ncbi:MAG: phosphatidate cytidylyltransferase [Armatimonadota bacterium]
MFLRLLSGIIGIPLLVLLVFTVDGIPFTLGIATISVIGLYEFYQGIRKTGANPQEWAGLASAFFFLFSAMQRFQFGRFSVPGVLTLFVIATLVIELFRKNRAPIKNLGATFLGVIYVGWLFSYLVGINSIQGDISPLGSHIPVRLGGWLVLYVTFTVWAADTGAFFIGRKWGEHKLAPWISPGKSWEGFAAGLVSSMVMSIIMGQMIGIPLRHSIVLGFGLCIAGLIGDLAESSMKRDIGIKDFGAILPGHGGVLDRFDGLLFAAPLFFYYVTLILHY